MDHILRLACIVAVAWFFVIGATRQVAWSQQTTRSVLGMAGHPNRPAVHRMPHHHPGALGSDMGPPVVQPQGSAHATRPLSAASGPAGTKSGTKPIAGATAAASGSPTPDAATAPPKPPVDETKGAVTGLPIPRWASLKSDNVNLRLGPGERYPIDWVYKRRDLPVEILREFEHWRLVEDQDHIKGWVHQATIVGHRTFVVSGGEHTLRSSADEAGSAVAVLKPGVIGTIRECKQGADWCEVQAGDYRGYLKRDDFYGSLAGEAIP